jgi:hypothetical protein
VTFNKRKVTLALGVIEVLIVAVDLYGYVRIRQGKGLF